MLPAQHMLASQRYLQNQYLQGSLKHSMRMQVRESCQNGIRKIH